jgi:hypothetical protein
MMIVMGKRALSVLAAVVLVAGTVAPAFAQRGGGGRGGGGGRASGGAHQRGGHHHGGHHHGGGVFFFGGGLGYYPYWGYPYSYPYYPYYAYPYATYPYATYPSMPYSAPVYVSQGSQPALNLDIQGPAVQREVVYPHGKHVLYGDGVNQPYQWVWVPAAPAPPPQ